MAATRTSLKSITEEQEAANEELKTANEEVLSSNEELQITNEELETAKEELQSANEELTTLNDELQSRNVELSTFADDLSSLLTGVNIPILILDDRRRIQRFTPAAQRFFNLIPTDIGRPFEDISSNLESPDWNELISRVTDQLQTVETDVTGRNGRWYSLRMRPYKTSENKIDGVLIALLDVDQLKRQLGHTEESLKTSQDLYRLMAENTSDLVAIHQADSRYIYVSPSRERLLGYSQQETIGKLPAEFCHPDDRKSVALAFTKAVRSGVPSRVIHRMMAKGGQQSWLETLISPIADDKDKVTRLLTSSRDITERKRADDKLRESEFTVRTLLESASQGIMVVDPKGTIVLANRAAEGMFGYGKMELLESPIGDLIPQTLPARHNKQHRHFFLTPEAHIVGVGLNLIGRRKNGKEFPIEARLSYMQKDQDTLAVAFVTDVSEHKRAEAALKESRDRLLDLSGKLMSVQDEESKRIARELHDAFSQELAALSTEARLLMRELPAEAQGARRKMEGVALRISTLAKNIHQMSRRLHPAILDDLGLAAALRAECNGFSQLHGVHTDFTSSKVPKSIRGTVALCLYRIAQECLQNIAKHSGSKKVRVDLALKRGEIQLAIQDFGDGFDLQAQKRRRRGLGLIGMEERMRLSGGTLTIESKPGRGTRVLARIPLKNER